MSTHSAASQRTWLSLAACLLVISLRAAPLAAQTTIRVPADQATIQAAINAASAGDTVLVAPGTYAERINFQGKAITLTSSGGPSVTTIDGGAGGTVVTFNHAEGANSVLSGFTITNGKRNGSLGGGVLISAASPTITGNVITGNHAAGGIGIEVSNGSPQITFNSIAGNNQTGAGSSGQGGGGIHVAASIDTPGSPQIIGNSITNNSVAVGGFGGGISVTGFTSPLIQNNLIQGNSAYNGGGGIQLAANNSPVVVQNVVVGNSSLSGGSGGGLLVNPHALPHTIVNNTVAANIAFDNTSGIFVTGFGQNAIFANNILVAAPNQTAVTCNSTFSSIAPVFSNNDVLSASGTTWAGICGPVGPPNNISVDPLFLTASDFHLQWGSPAVDAGTNSVSGLPSTDFSGKPRIVDGNGDSNSVVDLGAYELSPTTITLAPSNLTFASQPRGSTSAAQTVTLTNTGGQSLLFSISMDVGFAQTNSCGTSLAAGASCSIDVTFTPTVSGTWLGNVTLKDTASGNPHAAGVVGTGGGPLAILSSSSLTFGSMPVGSRSVAQIVTLTNSGDDIMAIAGISTSGDFAQTNTCGITLAAGASCPISVTFAPTVRGARSGSVNIADNASGAPHKILVNGTGLAPAVTLSSSSLDFGSMPIGIIGAAQIVTLTNSGDDVMAIAGITTGGDFAQTNTGGVTLAVGASCSISVTFAPAGAGVRSGSVNIADNAAGAPHKTVVGGTGVSTGIPMIATQPVSQTVSIGQTATFTVVASGGGTLSYQWKKNNVSIPGANSASYTTPPATINDDGATYRVGIQNSLGGVASDVATLSVPHASASITTQPISLTVAPRTVAVFAVGGAGTGPLTYQWRKNGISIPGATSSFYFTPEATLADNGTQFSVTVSNSFSGVGSNVVTLHVTGAATIPPAITTQPVSRTVNIGQTATFTVVATGDGTLTYQWKKNDVSIPGATSASYTTPPATINDDGSTYRVGVQNNLGGVASNVATLTVPHTSASITTQPLNQTTAAGQTATFIAVGAGTGPLIYQWRKNNISIPGATSASYTTPPATLADDGARYAVSVSNSFSGVGSNVVTLHIGPPPPTYTIAGTVVNLASGGAGLILQNNGANNLLINANGGFVFSTALPGGSPFNVTVLTQPFAPQPTCTVAGGTGTVTANVATVSIDCGHNEWSWIGGGTTVNQAGVYGTLGVPDPANTPGGRQSPATWTDASGNLWLFGGYGYDPFGNLLPQNDLWKYSAGQWTWMGGSKTAGTNGVYGTLGIASAGNIPGARFESSSWTDSSGNLWLFGGNGFDSAGTEAELNDLWEYSAGQWTWMGGSKFASQHGTYGTQGVFASGNTPGGRYLATSWTDASGAFWLFGGIGRDATSAIVGQLNDLWKYSGGQWTWISGSNIFNQSGTYGTQDVAASGNVPGGRFGAVGWIDSSGELWLFGGTGRDSNGSSTILNDLWRYDGSQWTWMSGSNLGNQGNTYGTQGVPSPANVPGARQFPTGWTDCAGNFWLFGGNNAGNRNDLWRYSAGQWTWMAGSNLAGQSSAFGTQGVLGPGNTPGSRTWQGHWVDAQGNFWMFGGFGLANGSSGNLNDLWMYRP